MARKRDDSGPRGRGLRTDLMNALRRGERSAFIIGSKALLPVLFVLFALLSFAGEMFITAALASVGAFITASVMFPVDEFRSGLAWIRDGGFGEWLYGGYLRIMPGRSKHERNRRGQLTARSIVTLVVVTLLVSSLLVGSVAVGGVAAQDEDGEDRQCTEVVHDAYLTDNATISEFNETEHAESTDRNIYTSIEKTEAFVRLKAENPNAYCVNLTVQVHPDIIPPADVGDVSAVDGDVESTWRNTHDFDRDQSYTEIKFTMDADSEVTFAPNRLRVLALNWKDEHTDPKGLLDRIPNPFGNDTLEDRTYTINSSNGSTVTVPLKQDGKSIDEWHAVYRVGDEHWRPMTTTSDDPVFYREVDEGDSLQFIFDEDHPKELEVEFTANPTVRDDIRHDYRASRANWSDFVNLDFGLFWTQSPVPLMEVSAWQI